MVPCTMPCHCARADIVGSNKSGLRLIACTFALRSSGSHTLAGEQHAGSPRAAGLLLLAVDAHAGKSLSVTTDKMHSYHQLNHLYLLSLSSCGGGLIAPHPKGHRTTRCEESPHMRLCRGLCCGIKSK
jgi:hypothetical protein